VRGIKQNIKKRFLDIWTRPFWCKFVLNILNKKQQQFCYLYLTGTNLNLHFIAIIIKREFLSLGAVTWSPFQGRPPALEINGKEKETVRLKKVSFEFNFLKFCRVSRSTLARPATAHARSSKLVFERGTLRSPCAAERRRERAHWCRAMDSFEDQKT